MQWRNLCFLLNQNTNRMRLIHISNHHNFMKWYIYAQHIFKLISIMFFFCFLSPYSVCLTVAKNIHSNFCNGLPMDDCVWYEWHTILELYTKVYELYFDDLISNRKSILNVFVCLIFLFLRSIYSNDVLEWRHRYNIKALWTQITNI